jgi:hypothetical protein
MTLEEMKAAVVAKATAVAAQAKEKAEMAGLTARMKLMDSEVYQVALTNESAQTSKHEAMEELIEQCKAVVIATPVHDAISRQNKKWNGRPTYGLGKDMELLHTLASGLLYSVDQHKAIMVDLVGLNLNTVEKFLNSLGNTAYYNASHDVIMEEVMYNLPVLQESVLLLGEQLGLAIDTSSLTEDNLNKRFRVASLKADSAKISNDALPLDAHFIMS